MHFYLRFIKTRIPESLYHDKTKTSISLPRPFHQVFWIEEDGQKIFFGGDVAPQLQQMKNKFIAKYDFDGRKCMELRQQWWQQGEEEKWTFLFYHDIKTPVFEF